MPGVWAYSYLLDPFGLTESCSCASGPQSRCHLILMWLGIDANQLRDQAGKHSVLANPEGPVGVQLVYAGPMDRIFQSTTSAQHQATGHEEFETSKSISE